MCQQKILLSACLQGQKVRYDGGDNLLTEPLFQLWQQQGRFVTLCPEVAGGLDTPREPAELQANGRIITRGGQDESDAFQHGAELARRLVVKHDIRFALMKAKSPSCGNLQIYDGRFNRRLIPGVGVTAALLMRSGVKVFNELQLAELAEAIRELE